MIYCKYINIYPVADAMYIYLNTDGTVDKVEKSRDVKINLEFVDENEYIGYFFKSKEVDNPDFNCETLEFVRDIIGIKGSLLVPIRIYSMKIPDFEQLFVCFYDLRNDCFLSYSEGYKIATADKDEDTDEYLSNYEARYALIVEEYKNK